MFFARTAVLAIAALTLSCGGVIAGGPYRPFQVGLWSGGAYTDDRNGAFSHCSAGVVYDSGVSLFVVSTEAHGWWLGFASLNWSLTPSTGIPVKLQFDGRPAVEIAATIADRQLLLVPMPEETRLIGTFWQSSKIDLVAQQLSFSLRLVATSGLASELANCVHRSVALDTPARNALPAPAPVVSNPAEAARAPWDPTRPNSRRSSLRRIFCWRPACPTRS